MSTYLYLECQSHDPPLQSMGEVGQHLYDLKDVRKMIANRDMIVSAIRKDIPVNWDGHFASNTANFLGQHPKCKIVIRDEYGHEHDIVDINGEP